MGKKNWFGIGTSAVVILSALMQFGIARAIADDCSAAALEKNVRHAAELIKTKGEAAFGELQNFRFCGEEGYVYIRTFDGIMLFHPVAPHLVGKNVANMKDAKGQLFAYQMTEEIKATGQSWKTYWWPKPGETVPSLKCGYGVGVNVNGQKAWVASGLYGIPEAECGGASK